jgi:hypothetical protein
MIIHFMLTDLGDIPETGLEEVIGPKMLQRVFDRLTISPKGQPMKLTLSEALMLYASHVCMNKLLVSKYDEAITSLGVDQLQEGHPYKSFTFFRSEMFDINSHFIRNVEKSLADKKSLHHLKDKLAGIELE